MLLSRSTQKTLGSDDHKKRENKAFRVNRRSISLLNITTRWTLRIIQTWEQEEIPIYTKQTVDELGTGEIRDYPYPKRNSKLSTEAKLSLNERCLMPVIMCASLVC